MTIPVDSANIYTDFQGLDELRLSADKRDPKAMEAAAKQFEALFVQQMLKSMRDASLSDGLFDGEESRFYLDMFDKQLSLTMTEGEGIGLAKMIVRQLQATAQQVDALKEQGATLSHTSNTAQPFNQQSLTTKFAHPLTGEVVEGKQKVDPVDHAVSFDAEQTIAGSAVSALPTTASRFTTPSQFVQHLWPHAQRIAKVLGVDPKVLIAQSALETGWGKFITRHSDGRSSNNYFNIKADQRWQGESVSLPTLEFRGGIPAPEKASFRAYGSIEQSFDDYANFIQGNDRYHQALIKASDLEAYTQELQQAGYATDPRYADKIMNIINGEPLNKALETVKLSLNETITSKEGSQ